MKNWALVTGASSGIGLELARLFATDGWNLVLVARDETRLRNLANELESRQEIKTRVVLADLSTAGAAHRLFESVRDLEITALVNNAGFGRHGLLWNTTLAEAEGMVQVNIMALMQLTRLFLPGMLTRKRGIILNVGSVAAFQPGPTMGVYYATKAFVYSFSQALASELKGTGVTVTVLNPGTTRTEFFKRAQVHMKRPFPLMDAAFVARVGYQAALKGKRSATPGLVNRLITIISPCLPSRFTASVVYKVHNR